MPDDSHHPAAPTTALDAELLELRDAAAYFRNQADELAGNLLKSDAQMSVLRHALKQKRQGFALLSDMLGSGSAARADKRAIFERTLDRISATLNMDFSIALLATDTEGVFAPFVWLGLDPARSESLLERTFSLPSEGGEWPPPLLVNRASEKTEVDRELQEQLGFLHFVGVPVIAEARVIAFLISGRLKEVKPFFPPLDRGDLETLQSIAGFLGATLENVRLYQTLDQRVKDRTVELREKNEQLSQTLQRLTETQRQLVMQEKLASLGALTAGIAHEIKNPLNFVNNFAEVSVGLTDDLLALLEPLKARFPEEVSSELDEITSDLRQNAAKIHEHGTRANSIVCSMLEHSRHDKGQRQEADLNALLRQFADLAVQGYRAQNPGAKVTLTVDCDPTLPRVSIVPQELGRVFLNLVGNACWAVTNAKRRKESGYTPAIRASTRALGDRVEVRISDNGDGIPAAIREKIFTPFFSTKPTGEGTGLGLSLSHDIVLGNGGSMVFETEEGAGTQFVVTLPLRAT
jgi:signal transduction histidine kinase